MTKDYGPGVSRTLPVEARQYLGAIWQANKPPLDAELNLDNDIHTEQVAQLVRASMHSGFLLDPMNAQADFETDASWSNFFRFGRQASGELAPFVWANVNGWLIPVSGTATSDGDTANRVDLWPPPSSDARIDLVFLEAWQAQIAPNPSTDNKPAADMVWKYGNVKFGGTNESDDIEDPTIGFETTERLQLQYRIRVFGEGSGLGSSVALDDYPDGLDDPNVVGQGTASAPVTGFPFTNMRETLGDPGLWRAGDGDPNNDLGTVDGYVYAVPIAAVFRRNTTPFVARTSAGNANQNGAVDRNPITASITDPAAATTTLLTATLTNAIDETTTGDVQVTNLVGSGLDNANIGWSSTFLVIDDEVFSIESVDTAVSPATMRIRATGGRGRWGTMAVPHEAGAAISFFNWRLDGLFADQIAGTDLLDLRRGVTMGEWDYHSLLTHNLSALFKNEMRSSFKQSGVGDTQGPVVVEVDTLLNTGTVPNQTEALDGPDGIRTVWSDASTPQFDVTTLLEDPSGIGAVTQFDATTVWEVKAGFVPGGFATAAGWENGTVIFTHIGGNTGSGGARSTFRDTATRAVRFLGPKEYWKNLGGTPEDGEQHPVTLRFLDQRATVPASDGEPAIEHPGPMYPLPELNFEYPFIVLGGIVNSDGQVSGAATVENFGPGTQQEVELTGFDFDVAGDWYSKTGGQFDNDPNAITKPLLDDTRTLYGMLTDNGRDRTGASSELYVVIWGDNANASNNGCWKVIGAGDGTAGYTTNNALGANPSSRLVVQAVNAPSVPSTFTNAAGLNAELRTQYINSEDGQGFAAGRAAMCIVITDLYGETLGTRNPWNSGNLGALAIGSAGAGTPVTSKMVMNTTIAYHPGRGGTARIADELGRFAVVTAGSDYLRQSPAAIDSSFPTSAGVPDNETYFDLNHVQTWNRLPSLGLDGPNAPSYGGNTVAFSEQDREAELFVDAGSKTVVFRPFLDRNMTLYLQDVGAGDLIPASYPPAHGGFSVDGAGLFQASPIRDGYPVPSEYMPRFGRQDIPFFYDTTGAGTGTFLQGIDHLFTDSTAESETQFNVIGGEDNTGVPGVLSIRFQTGSSSGLVYGQWGNIPATAPVLNAYQARLYDDPDVQSSDVGRGLEGIQLPPFLGIARLYGVFDLRDFGTGSTFESNRVTPAAGSPPNLLRTDAAKQTLFIVQGGAADVTGDADDHTYVIPKEAIDIRLSDSYVTGEEFADLDYVVECCVFGFARGWINKNNYVLARLHNGDGNDPTVIGDEIENVRMTIPAPAPANECYMAFDRTVYQGDPYMTRAGSVRTVSDYEHRYGQIEPADSYAATPAIQQFDSNGATGPETVNERALEVLASVDFWTTLGTGKIGGEMFAGTPLDVAYTAENTAGNPYTRLAPSATWFPWQVAPRTYTEGQRGNASHGGATLAVINNGALNPGDVVTFTTPDGVVTLTEGVDWAIAGTAEVTAQNIANAITSSDDLRQWVNAFPVWVEVQIEAVQGGAEGLKVELSIINTAGFFIRVGETANTSLLGGLATSTPLLGGVDVAMNATVNGVSPLKLTGATERLPLGLLLQDSDFLCEDPLLDGSSHLHSALGSSSADVLLPVPLTEGEEYTRVVGGVGDFIGMSDGGILRYTPYHDTLSPTGSRRFRLYRGGGSVYVMSGANPGGPVDWAAGAFTGQHVLKGAVLAGRAYLVRNFAETAFSGNERTSHGDELQMLVVTQGVLGRGSPAWQQADATVPLTGSVSPTGYGEGYGAADRYRLEGKPLQAGHTRGTPDLNPDLAIFPFASIAANAGVSEE